MICAVDQRDIGVAVAVEITPGKSPQAGDARERMQNDESAVPVISQHGWDAASCAEHDIEIAVRFDIYGPSAYIFAGENMLGKFCRCRYIRERVGTVLAEEAKSTFAGQHQISFEIVIEVNRQNAFRQRSRVGSTPGKWECGAASQVHVRPIRLNDDRGARDAQRDGTDPIPMTAFQTGDRLIRE